MKKNGTISLVLACVSLVVSIVCLCMIMGQNGAPAQSANDSENEVQYVMYVGTNDKDTYKPEISNEEAKKIVDETCLKYFDAYTLQEATGSWTDEKNNITHEYTLVCHFDEVDVNELHKAADELLTKLNQNTVLIEKDSIDLEFYPKS